MKIVLVALLLVSCTLAVDWTTYTCGQMYTWTASSFTCGQWATFPASSVSCLHPFTDCGIIGACSALPPLLYNNLATSCSNGGNQFTSSTGVATTGRP